MARTDDGFRHLRAERWLRTGAIALALASLTLVGCKRGDKSDKSDKAAAGNAAEQGKAGENRPASGKTGEPTGAKSGQGKVVKKPKRKVPLVPRKDVQALLDSWLESQNKGDFASYIASYSDDFRGVRRSGKKTVRLDFAGWKKERGRMFKRKMVVALRDVNIAVSAGGAEIRLIQDWRSGKYHDVGPKKLVVRKTEKGLRIAREEMLRSTIVDTTDALPLASPQLALVYKDMLVLAAEPDMAWGTGQPSLLTGEIPERDPECDDDPPDYEEDNNRYFYCEENGPENTVVDFVAHQEVKAEGLPPKLAEWAGRELALHGDSGRLCTAKVDGFALWSEVNSTAADIGTGDAPEHELAEAVLENGTTLLVAELPGACKGAIFARVADLPEPALWTVSPAPEAQAKAIDKALHDSSNGFQAEALSEGPFPPKRLFSIIAPTKGKGTNLAVASYDGALDCHEDGFAMAIWEQADVGGDDEEDHVFEDSDQAFDLRAAVDVDGDGKPELITSMGFMVWHEDEYQHRQPLDFPQEVIDACHCECE